mmetsp:Transcript_33785/g.85413  ORF Transcript_33785/g.85413 Transcript_33785/m.85413 type:complete len:98 (-) Transcript_33785:217-510(-)
MPDGDAQKGAPAMSASPVTVPSSPGRADGEGAGVLGEFDMSLAGGLGGLLSQEGGDDDDVLGCFGKGEASYFSFDDMLCAPEWASPAGGDEGMMCAL